MTFMDILSSMLAFVFDKHDRYINVSLNITCDYIGAGAIGETIYFKCIVKKIGKSVCFLETQIYGQKLNLISSCTHKKMYMPSPNNQAIEDLRKKYLSKL